MSSFLKRLLPVMAFLALGCAQVFGLQRGFVCECGNEPEVTAWDHCDGPHSEACHENESESVPHSKEDHTDGTDTRDHSSYKEDVTANTVTLVHLAVSQPALHVIDVLEWFTADRLIVQCTVLAHAPSWQADDDGRHWPRVLAHTIVLRV